MTNTKLIAKIKAEIEKRITDNTFGAKLELIDILAWLDTLESEKPMDLEEEVKRYYSDNFAYLSSDQPTLSILTNIARHFTDWQKERLFMEGLDAVRSDSPNKIEKTIAGVFVKYGMDSMKEQMMKEAVEGTIDYVYDEKGDAYKAIRLDRLVGDFGDKVKLYIVKED